MSFRYHPFYCEENVWWLTREPRFAGAARWVLFITGDGGRVALWHQRAHAEGPTVWDYHVVMLCSGEHDFEVWDLDTTLGLPTAFDEYVHRTFLPLPEHLAEFRPQFRLVEAEPFRSRFCSDRQHMRTPDGEWIHAPPAWDPPQPASSGEPAPSNLARFIDMTDDVAGQVMGLDELRQRFTRS